MKPKPDDKSDIKSDDAIDELEGGLAFAPGALLGSFLGAIIIGLYTVVTAPFWVPGLIIHRIRQIGKPKPKHRSTVRPLVPLK